MSTPLLLKAFVNERLTAAAEEIFQVFEKTIIKYEEEVCSSRQEIERLRGLLLDFTSNHNTDPPQPPIDKAETPQEHHFKQEPSPSLGWRSPDPPCIKQEDLERWDGQQEEVQEFKSFDWRKNQQEDPEVSLELHIQNSEREEEREDFQETKSVQFTGTIRRRQQFYFKGFKPKLMGTFKTQGLSEIYCIYLTD
ncbi:hypothetical protein LDENG_00004350 [Lucifuga dentata]|nr:hypothetical protein LDENG_00004350 [Lucifuga dentata]